jgi:hypothetical protein
VGGLNITALLAEHIYNINSPFDFVLFITACYIALKGLSPGLGFGQGF